MRRLLLCIFSLSYAILTPASFAAAWLQTDIGTHGSPGTFSNTTFSLTTYGKSIGAAGDNFTFASQEAGGNIELEAKIASVTNGVSTTQTGLMIRTDTTAASSFVMVSLNGSSSVVLSRRETAAGQAATVASVTVSGTPVWLRLKTVGTTVKAFQSADRLSWQEVGSTTFANAAKAHWGMACATGDSSGAAQVSASFQNATLISNVPAVDSKMKLWVRADYGITRNSQSRVGTWQDQSSYGNHLGQSTDTLGPLWSAGSSGVVQGMPYVTFDAAGKFLSAADATSLKPTTNIRVYAVVRRNSGTGVATVLEKFTATSAGYTLQMHSDVGRRFYTNASATSGTVDAADKYQFALMEGFLEVPGNRTVEINGTIVAESAQVTSNFSASTNPLYLGGRAGTQSLLGDISEVLILGEKLTENEVREMDAYIFSKYGLGTKPEAVKPVFSVPTGIYATIQTVSLSAPAGYEIYYKVNGGTATLYTSSFQVSATSTIAAFTRRTGQTDSAEVQSVITLDPQAYRIPQKQDLSLWLRSDSGIETGGGSGVSVWRDQSGKENHAVQDVPGNRPAWTANQLQGHPVVAFSSSAHTYLSAPALDASRVSVIAVYRNTRTTGTTSQIIAERLDAGGPSGYSMYSSSNVARNFRINGAISTFSVASPKATTFAILEGIYNQTARKLFVDGIEVDSDAGTAATASPTGHPVYIGGRANTFSMDGELAELLIYRRALDEGEQDKLEAYLYQRYQLGVQPETEAPTATVMSGVYTGPQTIQLNTEDPAAYIRYTLDGTTPTSGSTVYTGPIQISETQTLKAIAIRSPFQDSDVSTWTYVIEPQSNYVTRTNLEAWFRADAGVKVGSGNQVESWTDLSGFNSVHVAEGAIGSTAPQFVDSSGQPRITFDSSGSGDFLTILDHTELNPSRVSVFAIVRPNGLTNPGGVFAKQSSGSVGYQLSSSGSSVLSRIAGYNVEEATGWTAAQGYQMVGSVYDQDNKVHIYENGSLLKSVAAGSTMGTDSGAALIGKRMDSDTPYLFAGDIAEVLLYSRAVGEYERREIEAYLGDKYSIADLVPTVVAPSLAVGPGTTGMTRIVTASCAEPGALIRYTMDGSVPTVSSPIYSGPVTVFDSRVFRAVAFKNRFKASPATRVDVQIQMIWNEINTAGNETPDESNETPPPGPNSAWVFDTTATGFAGAGDNIDFFCTPCGKGGDIQWTSSSPAQGMVGIMMRTNTSAQSASAFVGFKAGDSNCYFISRGASGLSSIQSRIIAGVSAGDVLRLELVGNSVILQSRSAGSPTAPWQRHYGIDLFQRSDGRLMGIDLIESGHLVEHCLMGLAAATLNGSNAHIEVDALDVAIKTRDDGARWLRIIEPAVGSSAGKFARQGYTFSSSPTTWALQTPANSGEYISGDVAAAAEQVISMEMAEINCPSGGPLDLYVRFAPTGVSGQAIRIQVQEKSFNESDPDNYSYRSKVWFSKSLIDANAGCWVHVGSIPAGEVAKRMLKIYLDNISGGAYTATNVKIDAFLLTVAEPEMDADGDHIPDHLASAIGGLTGSLGIPFLAWGDQNGDGWSNYQALMLGSGINAQGLASYTANAHLSEWRQITLVKPTGEPDLLYAPTGRRAGTLKVRAEYTSSGNTPVPGYAVSFWKNAPWQSGQPSLAGLLLLSNPDFIPLYSAEPAGDTFSDRFNTFTGLSGEAVCDVFIAAEASPGRMELVTAGKVEASSSALSWKVATYQNKPPGPVHVEASAWKLGEAAKTELPPIEGGVVVAVRGDFMAIGHPDGSLTTIPGEGFVDLLQWDARTGTWLSSVTLPPPASGTGGKFGRTLNRVTVHAKEYLVVGSLDAVCFFAMTPEGLCELEPAMMLDLSGVSTEDWSSIAFGAGEVAVGIPGYSGTQANAGLVVVFKCSSETLQWTQVQQLAPASSKHSDLFGTAVAYSQTGNVLAIGAPGDLQWYKRPEGQPYYDEEEEEWLEPSPPADPSVYVYAKAGSNWSLEDSISAPSEVQLLGQHLAFTTDDDLLVGAPYSVYAEDSPLQYGPGKVQLYQHSGSDWDLADTLSQANPAFGRNFELSAERLFVRNDPLKDGSLDIYPASVQVFDYPWGIGSHSETFYPDDAIDHLTTDGMSVFLSTEEELVQYDLMPVVAASATSGTVATLSVEDENIAVSTAYPYDTTVPPFTDTLDLQLLNSTSLFELIEESTSPPAWPRYDLNVKSGSDLSGFAGQTTWLQFSATDVAGEIYDEAIGVRITGSIPGQPVVVGANVVARDSIRLSWNPLSPQPEAYIVERAALEDVVAAGSNPTLLEAAFDQVLAPGGWIQLVHDSVSLTGDGLVYRVKAQNNEGTSVASDPVTVEFDTDDDGIPDWWELLHVSSGSLGTMNGVTDTDGDGISDLNEYLAGTNPQLADSDWDGIADDDDLTPNDRNYNTVGLIVHTEFEKAW